MQGAGRPDVVVLGADNAGHTAYIRSMAAPAVPAGVRAPALLGKHGRSEESANATALATASTPAEPGFDAGAADVSAPNGDVEGNVGGDDLRTIGDQVAALPRGEGEGLRIADAHPAAELDAEETVTADSLTVLLSQVRHILCRHPCGLRPCPHLQMQPCISFYPVPAGDPMTLLRSSVVLV